MNEIQQLQIALEKAMEIVQQLRADLRKLKYVRISSDALYNLHMNRMKKGKSTYFYQFSENDELRMPTIHKEAMENFKRKNVGYDEEGEEELVYLLYGSDEHFDYLSMLS
jgi:hypothetical protein